MQYFLIGFSYDTGFRVFTFECVGPDRLRTVYRVKADLALSRRYRIPLQELPLLCRDFLQRCPLGEGQRTFTFAESEMSVYADVRAARTTPERRKAPRKPAGENVGTAWRRPQM